MNYSKNWIEISEISILLHASSITDFTGFYPNGAARRVPLSPVVGFESSFPVFSLNSLSINESLYCEFFVFKARTQRRTGGTQ